MAGSPSIEMNSRKHSIGESAGEKIAVYVDRNLKESQKMNYG